MEKLLGGSENGHIKARIHPLCATCWANYSGDRAPHISVYVCVRMCAWEGAEQMCFTPSLTSERVALIEGPGPRGLYFSLVDCPHSLAHTDLFKRLPPTLPAGNW